MKYIADLSEDSLSRREFSRRQAKRLQTLEAISRLCDGGSYEDCDHPLWVAREVLEKEIHADERSAGFGDQPTASLAAKYLAPEPVLPADLKAELVSAIEGLLGLAGVSPYSPASLSEIELEAEERAAIDAARTALDKAKGQP